jgi:peptide/nickel transport system substrate-binding protein
MHEITGLVARLNNGIQLSRRTLLRSSVVGVGAVAAGPLLAACGGGSKSTSTSSSSTSATTSSSTSAPASGSPAATTSSPAAATSTSSAGTPVAGGDVTVGVSTTYIDVLDPNVTAQTVSHEIMGPIFDTLLVQDRDNKQFFPALSSKWDVSPDGMTVTFTLNDGVKFHDGTAFNADAVKSNLDRMAAPESKSRLAGPRLSGFYDSATVVDPLTVKITFKQPNGSFLTDCSQDFMAMLSPTAVQKYGPDQIGQHPVGTGPFTFVEWVQNSHIKLQQNPDYNWASPMFKRKGPAYLKTLTFQIIPDDSARVAALESGQINYNDTVPTINFTSLKSNKKYATRSIEQPGIPYAYMLNTKRPPTDDIAVRQAINYGVDKKAIIQTLYQDLFTPAYGPLSPVSFAYNPAVETMYPFDAAKAKQILDAAGWKPGSDGIRVKDGKRCEIAHYTFTDAKVATVMQAQLKQIGIQSNVTLLDVGAVNEAATRGEVTNLAPLPYRDADPAVLSVALSIKNEGKGFAWTFHKDQQLDAELTAGQASLDPAVRQQHYMKAQELAMTDALLIPIYNSYGLSAAAADIQDVNYDVKGVDVWWYNVWIKKS